MIRWSPANLVWMIAYLLTMVLIVVGLRSYRDNAIAAYSSVEANRHWNDWRSAASNLEATSPVHRRAPKSDEPPPLVLMRDHFPACLGISLLLSSCLFGWFMICARGAFRPVVINEQED